MREEKQGAELAAETKAIALQQRADLEHLRKNTHPSLHDVISLGPDSSGTNQAIGDYAAITFRAEMASLKEDILLLGQEVREDVRLMREGFDELRSQLLKDWTPETPASELPQLKFAPEPEAALEAEVLAPEQVDAATEANATAEADAEHLRLNTKELPE